MNTPPRPRLLAWATRGGLAIFLTAAAAALIWQPWAERGADLDFDISIAKPALASRKPKVIFDHGHNNVHSANGRFSPFANLLRSDGCNVRQTGTRLTADLLATCDLLVIVNARGPRGHHDAPAFMPDEIADIKAWVRGGGALLLVADHHPCAPAAADLAAAFDVKMIGGWYEDEQNAFAGTADSGAIAFRRERDGLGRHVILDGAGADDRIDTVVTFTGQSLAPPANAVVLLKCAGSALDKLPIGSKSETRGGVTTTTFETRDTTAEGHCQALALEFGGGRVVMVGEAAMLSAQLDSQSGLRFGMNVPGCDNRPFVLNSVRWLLRALEQTPPQN